jgi:hypothetical protein
MLPDRLFAIAFFSSGTNLISCSWLYTFQKKAIAKNRSCDILHRMEIRLNKLFFSQVTMTWRHNSQITWLNSQKKGKYVHIKTMPPFFRFSIYLKYLFLEYCVDCYKRRHPKFLSKTSRKEKQRLCLWKYPTLLQITLLYWSDINLCIIVLYSLLCYNFV